LARSVRLPLALKGLSAELRDPRAEPAYGDYVRSLNPMHTVPVLVDGNRVLTDSSAICQYLDRIAPDPKLFPTAIAGVQAYELIVLTDNVVNVLSDLGTRYATLHEDPKFPVVRKVLIGRVQRALNVLAEKVTAKGLDSGPLCGTWSARRHRGVQLLSYGSRSPNARGYIPASACRDRVGLDTMKMQR
jgi:glutathione S-transferase